MNFIPIKFRKIGNHYYPNVEHDNPQDLVLDPRLERLISRCDKYGDGIVDNIYLAEQTEYIIHKGLIQFDNKDLDRYFMTRDVFMMALYIQNHKFFISSKLYALFERTYNLELHYRTYRLITD